LQLKNLDIADLIGATERAMTRSQNFRSNPEFGKNLSTLEGLWSKKSSEKAAQKLSEFSMCVACKRRVDSTGLERIIRNWLSHFDDPKNSDLDLDVEKFAGLGLETGLAYDIAFQIHQKVILSFFLFNLYFIFLQTFSNNITNSLAETMRAYFLVYYHHFI
jgi:hypothetical protein